MLLYGLTPRAAHLTILARVLGLRLCHYYCEDKEKAYNGHVRFPYRQRERPTRMLQHTSTTIRRSTSIRALILQ